MVEYLCGRWFWAQLRIQNIHRQKAFSCRFREPKPDKRAYAEISGLTLDVPVGQTLLEAIEAADIWVPRAPERYRAQILDVAQFTQYPYMPHVFLSYSHDSESHALKVLEFCNRLRADGVDAYIDRYVPAPSQGWPTWMVEQVESADFVLLICTDSYRKRFEGKTGEDLSLRWEGILGASRSTFPAFPRPIRAR